MQRPSRTNWPAAEGGSAMAATRAIGTSSVPANHVLGRKLDSIPLFIPVVFARKTVGQLEACTEAVPEAA